MKNKILNPDYVSPSLGGRLGNNMFMIANAYAQSLEQNKQFVVPLKQLMLDQFQSNIFRKIDFFIDQPNESSYSGYFQSEKYFEKYSEAVKSLFSPTPEFIKKVAWLYPFIENEVTCISVRRGDYLYYSDIHPVLSIEYIHQAYKQLPDTPYCLVFSDDKDWCKKNIDIPNAIFVDLLVHEQMWLMALCDYFIISNSSFSWWGEAGPSVWQNIYCKDWIVKSTYIHNGVIFPA
jgi:hypothetical protein